LAEGQTYPYRGQRPRNMVPGKPAPCKGSNKKAPFQKKQVLPRLKIKVAPSGRLIVAVYRHRAMPYEWIELPFRQWG